MPESRQPNYAPYHGFVQQNLVSAQVYPRAPQQFPARPQYRRGSEQNSMGAMLPAWNRHLTVVAASFAVKRSVQFLFDWTLTGLLLYGGWVAFIFGISWAFHVNAGSQVLDISVAIAAGSALFFSYWVIWPYSHDGQTLGMRFFGLQVMSADDTRATRTRLFVRAILLPIDAYAVGFLVMLASHGHQRIGDHAAKTIVISKSKDTSPS